MNRVGRATSYCKLTSIAVLCMTGLIPLGTRYSWPRLGGRNGKSFPFIYNTDNLKRNVLYIERRKSCGPDFSNATWIHQCCGFFVNSKITFNTLHNISKEGRTKLNVSHCVSLVSTYNNNTETHCILWMCQKLKILVAQRKHSYLMNLK